MAAMIRHSIINGKVPIFVTEKPTLYKDMYRDLIDIGMDPGIKDKILMTNGNESINLNDKGTVKLKSQPSKAHNAELKAMAASGNIGENQVVFTTYDQMNEVGSVRRDFITAIAKKNSMLILDESHNAGGSGDVKPAKSKKGEKQPYPRSKFVRDMVQSSGGVFYSSATYAKRPDVMDLYSKTDIRMAVADIKDLSEAIQKGGIPLQQVVATMLTEAGQYIRRERSFEGVTYNTTVAKVDHRQAEDVATALREIRDFDDIVQDAVKEVAESASASGGVAGARKGVGASGISSTNFSSVMHNLIDQMLLALKVDPAVDEAIAALKEGKKPVITLANTMGSFISEYATDNQLKPGAEVNLTFDMLLDRYLEKSREYTEKDAYGKPKRKRLTDDQLGGLGTREYKRVKKYIAGLNLGSMPVSPIDYIKYRLKKEGYTTDEITGRSATIDYTDSGQTLSSRKSDNAARGRAIVGFNSGDIDVLILNQSGATGISLHASERNPLAGQVPRHMIILQAEKNIDTHMQMLGRVHRTGQVVAPSYSQLVADIPAEKRPAAVLSKKMASLNANTTASKGSDFAAKDSPDFMNKYGDLVVAQAMENFPSIHSKLGSPLPHSRNTEGFSTENAAAKVTGRIPMLPIKDQESIYKVIEAEYKELIKQLDALGENSLEAKTLDTDARTLEKVMVKKSEGSSPFQARAEAKLVNMKRLGKPYTSAQVQDKIDAALDGKTGGDFLAGMIQGASVKVGEYQANVIDTMESETSAETTQAALNRSKDAWDYVVKRYQVGDSVSITMPGEEGYLIDGVVTNVTQTGEPRNPLALSTWKLNIALADSARSITMPFSKVYAKAEDGVGIEKSTIDNIPMFDKAQSISREERVIVTGNLLSGYDKFNKGRIVNYTDDTGVVNQGILMPRGFDIEAESKAANVVFTEGNDVVSFLNSGDMKVGTRDMQLNIQSTRRGTFVVSTAAAKSRGGIYFLDTDITDALGDDFVKSGKYMEAKATQSTIGPLVKVLYDKGYKLRAIGEAEKAMEITGEEIPKFQNGEKKPVKQFSKGAPRGTAGVSKADLESLPLVKKVTGKDGNYRVHFKGGISIPLKTIETVGKDSFLINPKGTRLFKRGWYDGSGITITQYGDKHTASHEMFHFAEDIGLISTKDKAVLNKASRSLKGDISTKDLPEARASFVEQAMRDREAHKSTKVGAILQKLADFFDQLVNLFKRTAMGSVRDFEKGSFAKPGYAEVGSLSIQHSSGGEVDVLYRFNNNKDDPMSDYGHAMFAESRESVEHYGGIEWQVDASRYPDRESLEPKIREAIEFGKENEQLPQGITDPIEWYGVDSVVDAFFPEDIVDSAEAYDNDESNSWLWEMVLEPNGFDGVKTPDGAVSYNPEDIFKAESKDEDEVQYSLTRDDVANTIKEKLSKGYLKGIWEDLTSPSVVDDISPLSRATSLISSYSRKVPGLRRAYDVAENKQSAKHEIENSLVSDGETNMMEKINLFKKKSKDAYKALSQYFDERDVNQIGYKVVRLEGDPAMFELRDPKGTRTGDTSSNQDELWDIARRKEADAYKEETGDKDAAETLYYGRKINDAEFIEKHRNLTDYIETLVANNLPTEIAYQTEDGQVVIDLQHALKDMGDRRSYYMPRIWQAGTFNLFGKKEGGYNVIEKFDSQLLAKRRARKLEKDGYTTKIMPIEKPSEELYTSLASTSAQETLTNVILSKMKTENRVIKLEDLSLHGAWDGDIYTIEGSLDKEYEPLFKKLGGVKKERTFKPGRYGWWIEWRFEGKDKNFPEQIKEEIFKLKGTDVNTTLAMGREFVEEYANTLKRRGARQSLLKRTGAKGLDVYRGYEEDMAARIGKSVQRFAGGKSKQDMALGMIEAINGRDISWDVFQQVRKFSGSYEAWEAKFDTISRQDFADIKKTGKGKPKYVEYQSLVNERMIDPVNQRNAYTDAMDFFKHMLRNEEAMDRAVGFVKGLAVIKYLGFRPAAAAVNMTNLVAAVPAVISGNTPTSIRQALKHVGHGVARYAKYMSGKDSIAPNEEDSAEAPQDFRPHQKERVG